MRHHAIRNTHPTVVSINGETDARDAQGEVVILHESLITAEIARLQAVHAATQYQRDRARAYPSLGDQLDMIFHAGGGGAEFQSAIAAVKARYPK